MQSSSQIVITNKPTSNFLRARYPSCHPTNSVKALKGKSITFHGLAHPMLTWGLPTFFDINSSWSLWKWLPCLAALWRQYPYLHSLTTINHSTASLPMPESDSQPPIVWMGLRTIITTVYATYFWIFSYWKTTGRRDARTILKLLGCKAWR